MEASPNLPGAPKKSKTGLILGCVALVVLVCCCGGGGAMLYFGKGAFGKAMGLVECGVAIGQQRDAMLAYAKAHGGKLPPALSWQDDIKPYVVKLPDQEKAGQPFRIPGPEEGSCDRGANTAIVLNSALAGKEVSKVKDAMGAIALFEAPGTGRNKTAAWKEPPFETSPKIFEGARRGWIRQPLYGQASYKNQNGRNVPVPTTGGGSASFGPVDVITKESPSGE